MNGATVGTWLYLMAATVIEVVIFYAAPATTLGTDVIFVIATVNAIATMAISMNLRKEAPGMQFFILLPVMLAAVLIITMLLAYYPLS